MDHKKDMVIDNYCLEPDERDDIFWNRDHNISTKREISSWFQDTKHKVFASVADNVKTLQLLFSIEDNKAEQVRGLWLGGKAP